MATTLLNSGAAARKVVAKGIPEGFTPDKLTIHFQKRKFGGGDVRSVTFPVSNSEPDTAIIEFEEVETVQNVLRHTHKVGDKVVTVSVLQPKLQIFDRAVAKVTGYVVEQLKARSASLEASFDVIMDSTGCAIEAKDGGYEVRGEWYQLQAAYERLQSMFSRDPGEIKPPGLDYFSRTRSPPAKSVVPPDVETRVSTLIDKDTFAYIKLAHSTELDRIKRSCNVDFSCSVIGDATKIEIVGNSPVASVQKAVRCIADLNQKISDSVVQDVVRMDGKFPPETADRIFGQLRPEFPTVHMDKVHQHPNRIIFIAPDKKKCRMAVDMFNHFLEKEIPGLGNLGTATDPTEGEDKNTILFDKDTFAFMQLTQGADIRKILGDSGADIVVDIIDDCVKLKLLPKVPIAIFVPQYAIDELQKLYNRASATASQETLDIAKIKDAVPQKVDDAIRKTACEHKDVHVAKVSLSSNHVIFVSRNKDKCEDAMDTFARFIK